MYKFQEWAESMNPTRLAQKLGGFLMMTSPLFTPAGAPTGVSRFCLKIMCCGVFHLLPELSKRKDGDSEQQGDFRQPFCLSVAHSRSPVTACCVEACVSFEKH